MLENLPQVPVLEPGEFLPDFIGIYGRLLPLGKVFQIIFYISESLKQLRLIIFPLDLAVLYLILRGIRLVLPGRPSLVWQGIGLVWGAEYLHGIP